MDSFDKIMAAKKGLIAAAQKIIKIAAEIEDDIQREYLLNFLSCQANSLDTALDHLGRELNDKADAALQQQEKAVEALNQLAGTLGVTPQSLLKGIDANVQLQGIEMKAEQGELT